MENLVSCLMVTLPVPCRFPAFKASVADYLRQTHTRRELLIVVNKGDPATRTAFAGHIEALQRPDIRFVTAADTLSLGQLRNLSLDLAEGEMLCQWDDDDLHHPARVESQLALLQESDCHAVLLQDVAQYFPADRSLYWCNWAATELTGHPGTLMTRKSAMPRYPDQSLAEDLTVALALKADGGLRLLAGAPHLFVYVSHGANSWDMAHHKMLAEKLAISRALLLRREAPLRDGLGPFALANTGINVIGNNGAAFTL